MLKVIAAVLVINVVWAKATPVDPVLGVFSEGLRYDYLETDDGSLRLVDNWLKLSDYDAIARYNPDQSNRYHLFTRINTSFSQVLVMNNAGTVLGSNYDASKRTVILIHGFAGSATSSFNTNLVPAFLAGDDCNVIILDWSAGSTWGPRAGEAGAAGGRFANWLMSLTGARPDQFTIVGYSVGGHGAGHLGRTMNGRPSYVIACDPAERWDADLVIRPSDGVYTEIVHTSVDNMGWTGPLGDVDIYPNGGRNMPGCITGLCDHERSFYYVAESMISGGFTSTRCNDYRAAMAGNCNGSETIRLGGILPKTGRTGIFHVQTNNRQPFSRG